MTRFRRTETNARDLARWKRERPLDTKRGVTQGETDRRATAVRPRTGNRQGSNPVQSQRSREILAPCVLFLQRSKSLTSRWVRVLFPWGERLKGLRTVVDRSDRVRLLSLDLLCPCFFFFFVCCFCCIRRTPTGLYGDIRVVHLPHNEHKQREAEIWQWAVWWKKRVRRDWSTTLKRSNSFQGRRTRPNHAKARLGRSRTTDQGEHWLAWGSRSTTVEIDRPTGPGG